MAGKSKRNGKLRTYRVPWPPTVNHLHTIARGRKIMSTAGRKWKEYALEELGLQRPDLSPNPAYIVIRLFPPDRRKMDIDNRIKAVLDLLKTATILSDDNYEFLPKITVEYASLDADKLGYALVEVGPYVSNA